MNMLFSYILVLLHFLVIFVIFQFLLELTALNL